MLKVQYGDTEVRVKFDHRILDPIQIHDLSGTCVDEDRKCSLATIEIHTVNNVSQYKGISICHPDDNFCRATGRKIALSFAMYVFSKPMRKAVWKKYIETCNS